MLKQDILILGAGPAGLGAAYKLAETGKSFIVIEKNEAVGGLARTLSYGRFKTDIGPHRFLSHDAEVEGMVEKLLPGHLLKVERLTRFYINGRFFLYPIELKNILRNIGPAEAGRIVFDFLWQRTRNILSPRIPSTLREQIILDFGRTLANLNMLNYTEKIWGLPSSRVSPDWAKQRIKGLSFREVFKDIFINSAGSSRSLSRQFYYPDEGTGLIYEKIKEKILKTGELWLRSYPVRLVHDGNNIRAVTLNREGKEEIIEPGGIISSIPITELVKLLEPKAPADVLAAGRNLKFRSHLSLFMTINQSSIFSDQWIYFPDKEIPFSRLTEPKNFSPEMAPSQKSSLLLEFFCWENDNVWKADKEELLGRSAGWLEKLGFLKRDKIMDSFIHAERFAYPVYDLNYKKNLGKVKAYLSRFRNLQLIGRLGAFRYNNQDQALKMGFLAARSIIENRVNRGK